MRLWRVNCFSIVAMMRSESKKKKKVTQNNKTSTIGSKSVLVCVRAKGSRSKNLIF